MQGHASMLRLRLKAKRPPTQFMMRRARLSSEGDSGGAVASPRGYKSADDVGLASYSVNQDDATASHPRRVPTAGPVTRKLKTRPPPSSRRGGSPP